jgi:hypothetical protein
MNFEPLMSIGPAMLLIVAIVTALSLGLGLFFVLLRRFRIAVRTIVGLIFLLIPASLATWGLSFLIVAWSSDTGSFSRASTDRIIYQYRWPRDINADGFYSISDMLEVIRLGLFIPGDTLLIALLKFAPGVARFFEFGLKDLHGWTSGIVSAVVWLATFAILTACIDLLLKRGEQGSEE